MDDLISNSLRAARWSFLAGTALFIVYFISNSPLVALFGTMLTGGMGIINLIYLLKLLHGASRDKANRKIFLRTAFQVCLNIPVATLYAWLVLALFNVMVFHFTNISGRTLENITIKGCDTRTIKSLHPYEGDIEWIPITTACQENRIYLEYTVDGILYQETVYGYVITGERIHRFIGRNLSP